MKTKLLFFIGFILTITLCGCRAHYPVAQAGGMDDMAYLLFVSPQQNTKKIVMVTLDNDKTFDAKVVKAKNSKRKGTSYAVSTGKKIVKVECDGQLLYNKEVFLSPQETKMIILP